MQEIECDILIIGGSLGAVSAALCAAQSGPFRVCLVTPTQWLGGQMTSEGVSVPDEYPHIETTGASRSYRQFRNRVRAHYREAHGVTEDNVGDCWANAYFACEPLVAHRILREMLTEQRANLQIFPFRVPTTAEMDDDGNTVLAIVTQPRDSPLNGEDAIRFACKLVLDGTATGDLLPLCRAEWIIGAEGRDETGEPNAPPTARPDWVQHITFPIVVERRPSGEKHVLPQPTEYAAHKARQKYSLVEGGLRYRLFHQSDDVRDKEGDRHDLPPLFEYRRIVAAANIGKQRRGREHDIALLNVGANDYGANEGETYPTGDALRDAQILQNARLASLGYLYYLQTEVPRDGEDGGSIGYPNLKPRPDIFAQAQDDKFAGLSPEPYIRESRRILALGTVRQQDIVARAFDPTDASEKTYRNGLRARLFSDSVGIGWYDVDIHGEAGDTYIYPETRPFQIPLGALVPIRVTNLLACGKTLGVSRIAGAAYRVHPIEWHIGEAAGALATLCLHRNVSPRDIATNVGQTRDLQRLLLARGAPVFWWSDLPHRHAAFTAAQMLGVAGVLSGDADSLRFRPDDRTTRVEAQYLASASGAAASVLQSRTRAQVAILVARRLGLL